MPPTEPLHHVSRASSRLRPAAGRRPTGGRRVRCEGRRSLSPVEWLAVSALPLLAAAWAGAAHGNTLTVQATVAAACSAETATLNFGQYVSGQTTALRNTNTAIRVSCPAGVRVAVKLGAGGSNNGTARGMARAGSTDVLRYNLYQDNQFSQVWGDGQFEQAKTISSFDPSMHGQQIVHGEVPAGQVVSPGDYSDQVAITVELTP